MAITPKRFYLERWETTQVKGLEPLYLLIPVTEHLDNYGTIRKPGGSTYNPPRRLAAEAGKCLQKESAVQENGGATAQ